MSMSDFGAVTDSHYDKLAAEKYGVKDWNKIKKQMRDDVAGLGRSTEFGGGSVAGMRDKAAHYTPGVADATMTNILEWYKKGVLDVTETKYNNDLAVINSTISSYKK
jgi:hypothetical protein